MLKFLFWSLLLANVSLAAYQMGYLDSVLPNGHEPSRLDQQIQPERLRLVPAVAALPAAPADPAASTEMPVDAAVGVQPVAVGAARTPVAPVACMSIGTFNTDDARRFAERLGPLAERATRRSVQESANHMVYMPPQPDREAAERKAAELRRLGVEDFFIIQDNSNLRWGISLGVFKTEEGAQTHLAALQKKGVRSARIGQRNVSATHTVFEFRELDEAGRHALEQARTGFGRQELKECEA